jgi:hypothetical protein
VQGFNGNGIDASPDGEYLLVVNSTTGLLYRVDPGTGEASEIDLGGEEVGNGDGILLDAKTLYVVRNRNDLIAVVELDPEATEGEVVDHIEDDESDVPTTVAEYGDALYAVNARLGTENPGKRRTRSSGYRSSHPRNGIGIEGRVDTRPPGKRRLSTALRSEGSTGQRLPGWYRDRSVAVPVPSSAPGGHISAYSE